MINGPAYYNEIDPAAAEWIRELIRRKLITDGVVDDRSIADVRPGDLVGFRRVHFFAGIGLWDHALNLAGWGDDPIWTGSCPCQPFSSAGRQQGEADERHLWPEFFRLIRECRPRHVCGEQVASAAAVGSAARGAQAGAGRVWLDGVFDDLEAAHYACWAADLPAASLDAPHIRQRLWWWGADLGLADGDRAGCGVGPSGTIHPEHGADGRGGYGGLGHSQQPGLEGHARDGHGGGQSGRLGPQPAGPVAATGRAGPWSDCDIIECSDGKRRRIPAGSQPVLRRLVDGDQPGVGDGGPGLDPVAEAAKGYPLAFKFKGRRPLIHGIGNAIVPDVAAAFVRASRRVIQSLP